MRNYSILNMKKLCYYLGLVLAAILMVSCSQSHTGYDHQEVADMIASHDTTILYFMTSWCQASQSDFESNVKPYLGKASDTKAIVVVCVGEVEQVLSIMDNLDKNILVCLTSSQTSLLDKMFINKECKKLLSHYKRVNYVPIGMVCNRNGEILNWDTGEESGRTYGSIYPYLMGWK